MAAGDRRLAAVWFADIVGFTSLTSRDEEAALGLIRIFQEAAAAAIDRHDGTLVKFTGDGVLAYASSTSAALDTVLALAAGFDAGVKQRGGSARLRAGVHVGDIVVAADGDVYGEGVNIASRLEGQARPGRAVVSEDVWRHCRQRSNVEFVSIGPRDLKGITEPIWAYEVALTDDVGAGEEDTDNPSERRLEEARSIAVLPFQVVGSGEESEFLAVGLHNDLLTELAKVPELTVISRTSVMGYRGTNKPIPRIARELRVGTIIEGAVQTAGRRVRLTVQLIDGLSDVHRWAETYDRELTTEDLFAIQSDLARQIVESLHAELVPRAPAAEAGPATTDLEAYGLVSRGRIEFDLRTEKGLQAAIGLFERAVEIDPNYSDAWVGLADALALTEDYGYGDRHELLPRAEQAVHRALALDPDSAGAHSSLGLLYTTYQDGPAAIAEFEQAVALQPSYAEAHNLHSWVSLLLGRAEVALASATRAVELNPLSAEALNHLALSRLATGQEDKALVEARRATGLSPFPTAVFYTGIALYELGRFDEATSALEPLAFRERGELSVAWAGHGPDATLALAHVAAGRADEARDLLGEIDAVRHPFASGLIRLALGEDTKAFADLMRTSELSAWPTLAVHHHYRRVWDRIESADVHQQLVRTAYRSWNLEAPPPPH
jgi:adenylate cyclase